MAHSFIFSFDSQHEAFRAYAEAFPDRTVPLLDTYDTVEGARQAVKVGRELEAKGHRLLAVRLDSGDFDYLSRQVRKILDTAGLEYVKILSSGGFDEPEWESLTKAGAPSDTFGVGTKVGVSADAPWTDMVYKMVCYGDRPVIKRSTDKVSLPGAKQVFRMEDRGGEFCKDILGLPDEDIRDAAPLLTQVMAEGRRTSPEHALEEIRERFCQDFGRLDGRFKALVDPPQCPVAISGRLERLTAQVKEQILASP